MSRDTMRTAAVMELMGRHENDEQGGQLAAALGRVSLAYDLWIGQRREALAELLIDAALDAAELIHVAAGQGGDA